MFGANPDWYEPYGLPGHDGLDIIAPIGRPVKSIAAGTVYMVYGSATGHNYGRHVRVQYDGGIKVVYAHLDRVDVQEGQAVTAGQVLGLSGNTGNSSGPHLHLSFKKDGVTYVDKNGKSWPFNLINPWPLIKHLYRPDGRQWMTGYVYDYITEGSDGEGVNFSVNLNLRTGTGATFPIIGQIPALSPIEITGAAANGYYPVAGWAVPSNPPAPAGIDLRRFMIADPAAFRVVRGPGGQEDVQDLQLGGGLYVRRKNQLGEWWKVDGSFFYLIHDTSPDKGTEGIERVYTLTKGGQAGSPKNPLFMAVGQSWTEAGTHHVQFRAKNGCGLLSENSGNATNTAVLVSHRTNYTFNTYGQNLTFDEVIWLKTGVEMQVYGRKDGKAVGWIGWDAPWGKSEPVEVYWDRLPMTDEPTRYCSW